MEIKLFANLVEVAGERTVSIEADKASTLEEALDQLFETAPDLKEEVLEVDGTPCDHINILVNGTNIAHDAEGLDRDLETSDEIAIFPPVSGG